MQDWTFKLEVITPLFLSGVSQYQAELRPPIIKDLMRFWYRTCFDTSFLQKTLENTLYGSTKNQGKFKPTIKNIQNFSTKEFTKSDFDKYTEFNGNGAPLGNGINYLGFSLEFGNNHRCYVTPKMTSDSTPATVFDLCLKYFGNSDEEKKAVLASLWLLIWLGDLGTRSRRGFGSLSLITKPLQDTYGLEFYFDGEFSDFKDFFQANLCLALKWINPGFSRQNYLPKHTAFVSDKSRIYLWKTTFPNWEEALNRAGSIMQQYRKRYSPDYQSIKDFIEYGTVPDEVEKSAFGLPLMVQYKSLFRKNFIMNAQKCLFESEIEKEHWELKAISRKRKWDAINQLISWNVPEKSAKWVWQEAERNSKASLEGGFVASVNDEKAHPRRSSPLFIKIIRINDNEYVPLFCFLPSEFLSENEKLKITASNRSPKLLKTRGFKTIEDFLRKEISPVSNSYQILF